MASIEVTESGSDQLALKGELTFDTAMHALGMLNDHLSYRDKVVLDLSQIFHSDSAALAVLIECMRIAKAESCNLAFINCPNALYRLVKVAGLDTIVPLQ